MLQSSNEILFSYILQRRKNKNGRKEQKWQQKRFQVAG